MGLNLITGAASAVVTTAEAKAWCRVEGTDSDSLIAMLVGSATRRIEALTGRTLGEQTWQLTLDQFADTIDLPRGPVIEIVADGFTYLDTDGATQVVDADVYTLDITSDPQIIVRNPEFSWPALQARPSAVQIEFSTGYAVVPEDLKEAILRLVAHGFDNREDGKLPQAVLDLVEPYRALWITA